MANASLQERVDVSVLVPVLNEAACIRETVAAMQAQEYDGGIEFLLLDGGSDDGTRAILEELAAKDRRIRVLDNPARRTPHALNIGLRAARGEYVARMDAHALYTPHYLAVGIERLRRGDVAWVSGPALPQGVGVWSKRVELALRSWLGVGGAGFRKDADREHEVDRTFAGVWRRTTLEAYGGWDEGWPVNQDSELAARIRKDGGRIVCLPEMGAAYFPRNSLSALARQYWRYGQYRAKTSRRHPESLNPSHLLAPALALVVATGVLAPRPLRRPSHAGLLLYALCVLTVSARSARPGQRFDAALLPAVFVTMHLAWGSGFIFGSARFGVPVAALARFVSSRLLPDE